MGILASPIHYVRNRRARKRRIQTVLRMLSVSGVIRPGHVEPRYVESSIHVDALHRQGYRQTGDLTLPAGDQSNLVPENISFDFSKLRELVRHIRASSLTRAIN